MSMGISENVNVTANYTNNSVSKTESNDGAKDLQKQIDEATSKQSISMNANFVEMNLSSEEFAKNSTIAQSLFDRFEDKADVLNFLSGKTEDEDGNKIFSLKDLGYDGKPITELTVDEAKELVSEDGFFGVEKTAQRSIDFVTSTAGNDVDLLKAGRDGMIKGFKDAEKLWGEKLPDIAYKTQDKILETLNKKIEELGGNVLDVEA